MDFTSLVQKRYSVRAYKPEAVEEEKIDQILEAARFAPTAANKQPFKIIVTYPEKREDELRRVYSADWFVQAPVVICICVIRGQSWVRKEGKDYGDVDAAIVMDHIIMQATELGLGTCWIAAFDPQAAREVFQLPENIEPVIMTTLGYPADSPRSKRRKDLNELVRYDVWK